VTDASCHLDLVGKARYWIHEFANAAGSTYSNMIDSKVEVSDQALSHERNEDFARCPDGNLSTYGKKKLLSWPAIQQATTYHT
jgi:hypothetical protein